VSDDSDKRTRGQVYPFRQGRNGSGPPDELPRRLAAILRPRPTHRALASTSKNVCSRRSTTRVSDRHSSRTQSRSKARRSSHSTLVRNRTGHSHS
jgi:hypothetical protein